jgi:diguanylate cyclase (GGDEF)-like protein
VYVLNEARIMPHNDQPLADQIYVELVRSLYANRTPALIMSAAFALAVVLIHGEEEHRELLALGWVGILTSVIRLSITALLSRKALTTRLDRRDARSLELAFGASYVAFAACLGIFGARAFLLDAPEAHMLVICLLVGYCAGVATGAGLRPMIAISSMMLAILPAAIVSALRLEPLYLGMSLITVAFLAGGTQSVLVRVNSVTAEVTKQLAAGALARRDSLTGLPNRLELRERYEENRSVSRRNGLTAVHYLDLDGFKPVNDRYGHAAGDDLLCAVAKRLTGCVRREDIVARLGGDEFAILQFGLQSSSDAEILANRVSAAVRQPFQIGKHGVQISVSIGSITTDASHRKLEDLLSQADQELYSVKRARVGPSAHAA